MKNVCLYFHAHQPNRLKEYTFFEIGHDHFYENDALNIQILNDICDNCYLPTNKRLLKLIETHGKNFKVSFSLTGVLIEQMEENRPDVLESFKALNETGCVEFVCSTYYNSLAYLYSIEEFDRQVELQRRKLEQHFGQYPKVIRNTGLIYSNEIAAHAEHLGFEGILAPGSDWHLNGRSPNILYKAPNVNSIKTILSNENLRADICTNATNHNWEGYPLTSDKLGSWILNSDGDTVNIFMDYEVFDSNQSNEHDLFEALEGLPNYCLNNDIQFFTPSEVIEYHNSKGIYDIHNPISWSDSSNNTASWNGNAMQIEALTKIYALEPFVKSSKNKDLIHVWSKLQTADNFHYMSTHAFNDWDTGNDLSPYDSPYSGYIFFMNALADLEITCDKQKIEIETAIDLDQDLTQIVGINESDEVTLKSLGFKSYASITQMSNWNIHSFNIEQKTLYYRGIAEDWARKAIRLLDDIN